MLVGHLGPNLLPNFVDRGMFKISPKVQKSLWFDGAQLLRVSDPLLGVVYLNTKGNLIGQIRVKLWLHTMSIDIT